MRFKLPYNKYYNKYSNTKVELDGYTFDSKKERDRYLELKLLQKAGEIEKLEIHPKFDLLHKGSNGFGQSYRGITYEADFMYTDSKFNICVVEDVKGIKTETYKIKRKLFMSKYIGIKFIEI